MEIKLTRTEYTDESTIGYLSIDGIYSCYTLEDTVRPDGVKVPGKTAIPAGRYEITIDKSTRFKRLMPHILNVPMFEGIRIHAGNDSGDTEGCILLGTSKSEDSVGNSLAANAVFFGKLHEALEKGKVFIEIVNRSAEQQTA